MRLKRFSLFVLLTVGGCATQPDKGPPPMGPSFPANGLIIQRAVLTARGRQFTLNGYLSVSAAGGKRLIVTENFGNVLADVLVKPDGAVHVMRSSQAFPPKWIQRYVAADLQCVFGGTPEKKCPVRMLSPTHFVIDRFWYDLDLQIVQTQPGPQPPATFEVTAAVYR